MQVYAESAKPLDVVASATARFIAGKATLTVAPGKNAVAAFSARLATVPAGEARMTARPAGVAGADPTVITVATPAHSCG